MPKTAPADVLTILEALQAEMELYARTGMRVSPGRVVLWLHEVRLALHEVRAATRKAVTK